MEGLHVKILGFWGDDKGGMRRKGEAVKGFGGGVENEEGTVRV